MQLQFEKTTCKCLKQVLWETENQEQTQEVRLTDAMPDIGTVLGTWGQAILRGKEWSGGQIQVSGGVMIWVLYRPEDESPLRTVETWIPYQMKWDAEEGENGYVRASPLLRFADARSTSPRKLLIRAGISMLVQAAAEETRDLYTPGEVPSDVQLLKRTYPVTMAAEAGEKRIPLEETLTLPVSCPVPEKLLRYSLRPEPEDRKVMSGKAVFRGTAALHVLYRGTDGMLHSWDFPVPFSAFSELSREYGQEADADIMLAPVNLELELRDGELELQAELAGQYVIYDRYSIQLVQDVYSPVRQADPVGETLELPALLETRQEQLRAECSGIRDGQTADVSFTMGYPEVHETADGAALEFSGLFQLLRYEEDGILRSSTERWETEWNLPAAEQCRVRPLVYPVGRPDGTQSVRMEVHTTVAEKLPAVEAVSLGEPSEPDPSRPSLILRKAGEDCLWSLAKSCGSTVEAIQKANHLTEEPDPERILLIPVS